MITEHDLKEAIAECQGIRDPNANTCIKLAAYYIILDHMQAKKEDAPTYSYSKAPMPITVNAPYISYQGESDFAQKIDGMECDRVLNIMDELMDTISILNPSLYKSVIRKLSE